MFFWGKTKSEIEYLKNQVEYLNRKFDGLTLIVGCIEARQACVEQDIKRLERCIDTFGICDSNRERQIKDILDHLDVKLEPVEPTAPGFKCVPKNHNNLT